MIITKTPLRISFCGGGTDMAAFYERAGYGAVVSTSIEKFVYLAIHRYFENRFLLKYSSSELTESVAEIKHPLIRECLQATGFRDYVEVTSFADIPAAGSGLGSSSAFSVGLIHALLAFQFRLPSKETCAATACEVEIGRLGEPIGKQDQYAASFGGLNYLRFNADGSVWVKPIIMPPGCGQKLQSRLRLYYTGLTRSASTILTEQKANLASDENKFHLLFEMREQAEALYRSLLAGDLEALGTMLDEGWQRKRRLASGISSPDLDNIYERARQAGAAGGKLLGAGGGGFFLFYCAEDAQPGLDAALSDLRHIPFEMDREGTRIIFVED